MSYSSDPYALLTTLSGCSVVSYSLMSVVQLCHSFLRFLPSRFSEEFSDDSYYVPNNCGEIVHNTNITNYQCSRRCLGWLHWCLFCSAGVSLVLELLGRIKLGHEPLEEVRSRRERPEYSLRTKGCIALQRRNNNKIQHLQQWLTLSQKSLNL